MATSIVGFRERKFWIHNAVAEVWFSSFAEHVALRTRPESWLLSLRKDVTEALMARWIDGVTMTTFDSYLIDDARIAVFSTVLLAVNQHLSAEADRASTVCVGEFCASRDFLRPEISMLANLFLSPDQVLAPPHVFVRDKGWCVA